MPTRKNVSFAQQIAIDRRGNPYIYGGNWDPYKRGVGTDCSGCVTDELDGSLNGTAMAWTRHNLSTENWRPPSMGGGADPTNGPFGTVMVDSPNDFPASASVLLAFHHGPGGGANSHTWCQVDKLKIETMGGNDTLPNGGTVLFDGVNFLDDVLDVHTVDSSTTYGANNWWYLPGPIQEDGTPIPAAPSGATPGAATVAEAPDTLWADVSEFQTQATSAYTSATYAEVNQNWNYRWISIRSNDGDHVDGNFAPNYQWCVAACAAGLLDGFIVYYYWRPGNDAVNNHMQLVNSQGGPHPQMVSMMDVETTDGNPTSDVSTQLNSDYATLSGWLGNAARVIGYGNSSDLALMWATQPSGLMLVVADYGANPNLSNQIAHQYTNGQGYGGGLPEGVAPFGNCDMNSADGYTSSQLAVALGISAPPTPPVVTPPVVTPPVVTPPTPATPLTNAQMQDLYNLVALTFQQVGGVVPGLDLLPGSPTPMPSDWPIDLSDLLKKGTTS